MKKWLVTYGEHYRSLIILGFPIILGQIGIILVGFADTIMVGHHSTNELAAAGLVNNLFALAIVFSTGFAYGLTPLVGDCFAKKEYSQVGKLLKNSLFVNGLVSILLTFLMLILYFNLDQLGQPAELLPLIKPYYLIQLGSLGFILLFNSFRQFSEGITDSKTAMWVLLIANLVNIIGNYLLIFGVGGFPELGLLGAGISTLFSRILMLLIFCYLFFYTPKYAPYLMGFKTSFCNKKDSIKLQKLGFTLGIQMGMETGLFNISTIMVGWLGTVALASHQILSTIATLGFMVYYGMGAAITIRVSNFKGLNNLLQVKRTTYAGLHLILGMATVVALFVFFARNYIGDWFTDSDQEVSELVALLCIPTVIYQFGDAIQITFVNALRGILDVKPLVLVAFICYFLIALPAGYFFGIVLKWGTLGIWIAFPLGLTLAGILLWLRFRANMKRAGV